MTAKEELINTAILELRHQGVGYQEIFDQLARQIREPELFLVLVRVGPNSYKIHVGDKSTSSHRIDSILKIFRSAAMRADGTTEEPGTAPEIPGEPFELDSKETARLVELLARDQPSGIRSNEEISRAEPPETKPG
jgi:hypothetical protein